LWEVNGTVSLDLKDVTVHDVMNIMRDVYGYDYEQLGNLFRVYPDVLRTEIFQIDYLNVERKGRSEVQVSAGRVTDANRNGNVGIVGGGMGGYGGVGVSGNGASGSTNVVGTKINTEAETNFWEELEETLKTIISADEGGQIVVTPQVGLAVVRAKPESLHAVRDYLAQVENTLHRQVIIEATTGPVLCFKAPYSGAQIPVTTAPRTRTEINGFSSQPSSMIESRKRAMKNHRRVCREALSSIITSVERNCRGQMPCSIANRKTNFMTLLQYRLYLLTMPPAISKRIIS